MLKPTVKRGLMLDFIPDTISSESIINPNRIYSLCDKPFEKGDIIYMPTRELRFHDNWAVVLGLDLAEKYKKKFKIIISLSKIVHSKRQSELLMLGLNDFSKNSRLNNIDFEITEDLPKNISALIIDFNPLYSDIEKIFPCNYPIYEVDSHNIIPARYISQKQEFSAAILRRKVYLNIAEFLTEYPSNCVKNVGLLSKSERILNNFIKNKLEYYAEYKNNTSNDVTSHLSPYLHFGFISSQRVAIEVLKSNATRENKEAFLEELIVRKELADNYCLYNENYSNYKGIPEWAKVTLNEHRSDIRTYVYSLDEFEFAKTHDALWNSLQQELLDTGHIHGYPRMYWAKKILEWSKSPEEAIKIAILLNDKYALDGNDPNGYTGILWSCGGLHDRPFADRLVTGKIRYMSYKKIK